MNKTHTQFTGSIPEAYDTFLGPLLFEFSAKDLAGRIAEKIPSGGKILEIACGTGISTNQLRKSLSDDIKITATDLNPAMLDFAKSKHGDLKNVTFEVADALSLSFEENSFDAVVCQFGIMFFPDKLKGLQEMYRVLKPGGGLAFNVWDSFEKNPCASIVYDVIEHYFKSDPPQFLKMPFGFHDIPIIRDLIESAGFNNIEDHTVSEIIEGSEVNDVATGFITGNPNIIEINERATVEASVIINAAEAALLEKLGPPPIGFALQEIVFLATKT
ncbi:MAG: methyltransferase domain-containing protein [Kordiimonadaceae bacterium]|jgi:ubiquinone/menaquinone biosynthesis C-methylase UbiE|nr:methyltransferase domain-containing protein [Kordiimonadaceae bacterium]MBT6035676.1 methyltransferase domain-containing protein [Kordiimonadaceae bacterium]MBT6330625.1 methyltransferase domain-containing protein [Kordiimonadaceae bacterium]MBT7583399.1 methyltransferase domain-containing protein [Kordiimonadaceae bacterium]